METAKGNCWSMGLSDRKIELRQLDHETALVTENSKTAPLDLAIIPAGIEAVFGSQKQVRGFVLSSCVTNRFLPPSGMGIGNLNGLYFGFRYYRIPREKFRVRLFVNSLHGGFVRVASADPCLKIGVSKTTSTTVVSENMSGHVEYAFSNSVPEFLYSDHNVTSP